MTREMTNDDVLVGLIVFLLAVPLAILVLGTVVALLLLLAGQ